MPELQYTINRNGVLEAASDLGPDLVILEGVTAIGERVFKGAGIESVTFPVSLETIRTAAFQGCGKLKTIHFSTGLRTIQSSAFRETGLQSAVLPEGLEFLPANLFCDCKELREVEIPEGVTALGSDCFKNCTQLESVRLPESLTEIGDRSFDG